MFLTGIHSSAIQLPESKEAIILPMYRKSILILLLIVLAVAGGTYYGCYMQEKESIQLDAASQTVTQGGSQLEFQHLGRCPRRLAPSGDPVFSNPRAN